MMNDSDIEKIESSIVTIPEVKIVENPKVEAVKVTKAKAAKRPPKKATAKKSASKAIKSAPKAEKSAPKAEKSAPKTAKAKPPVVKSKPQASKVNKSKALGPKIVIPVQGHSSGLAEKQLAFCEAYIALGGRPNQAIPAAQKAGYGSPNKRSNELLKNPNVIKYLQKLNPKVEFPQPQQKKAPAPVKSAPVKSTLQASPKMGLATRENLLNTLSGFIHDSKLSISERIQAIEALSHLNGWSKK